ERADRLGLDLPGLDRRLQGGLDEAEAEAQADLPPALPAEHRGRVEQRDALHRGVLTGVEEGLGARLQGLHGIPRGGHRRGRAGPASPALFATGAESPAPAPCSSLGSAGLTSILSV